MSSQIKWSIPAPRELQLDQEMRPSELLLPVAADTYQLEAIFRAAAGESFVLHGPPGSGKSQTITNIIANALYQGKRVLFVAEKMAALSVVHRRLSQIGLAPFCLELHSNKATKNSVISQLEEASQCRKTRAPEHFESEAMRLYELRQELRQHVQALHEPLGIGLSLYELLYAIEQLADAAEHPYKPEAEQASALTPSQWADALHGVARLQSAMKLSGSPATHPLKGVGLSLYSPESKEEAATALAELLHSYEKLSSAFSTAAESLGLPELQADESSFALLDKGVDWLLGTTFVSAALLRQENPEAAMQRAQKAATHGKQRDEYQKALARKFKPEALKLNASDMLTRWNQAEQQWFLPRLIKQWSIKGMLKEQSHERQIDTQELPAWLKLLITTQEEQAKLDSHEAWLQELFGEQSQNWQAIEDATASAHEWTHALLSQLGGIAEAQAARHKLADSLAMGKSAYLSLSQSKLKNYRDARAALQLKQAQLTQILQLAPLSSEFATAQQQLQSIQSHLGQLRDWCAWRTAAQKAQENGLAPFVNYLEEQELEPHEVLDTYKQGIYTALIRAQVRQQPTLSQFNGLLFEELLLKYRELVAENQELSRKELCAKLAARVPNFTREGAENSELGILQRHIRSRGRGMSIRKLFDELPTLMPRLKPCMLMSPMSVSQYLNASNEPFDLVIFDEASQMPTCEAVGSIARGRSLIVVGDPKQMPPTSFFSSNTVDEDHLDIEDLESILEDCLALSVPSRYLRWHYRSKHESLIAFSNAQYYDNKLLTFPSPDDLCSKISLVPVKGYYDKGKSRRNMAEAQAVVAEILHRLADPILAQKSIGVISFSQVQQSLIEDLLMQAFAKPEHAELEATALGGEEPLFVKNLENVQGDERDVILFSVGYGPDEQGRVSLNFGPLNREGGWRRLNVAVSRARYEMKVFSTLLPEHIELSRTRAQGVAGLRAFLDFAQKGKIALLTKSGQGYEPKPSLVELLAEELEANGYEVRRHIGSSSYRIDLGVIHPERPDEYLAALICDGASYQAAPTLRDREVTRVGVLGSLGWQILRIWSMDWYHDRERVMQKLLQTLEELQAQAPPAPEQAPADLSQLLEEEDEQPEAEEQSPELAYNPQPYLRPYTQASIAPLTLGELDPLQAQHHGMMKPQVEQILAAEAPIHQELLTRKLMEIWGVRTLNARTQNFFAELYDKMQLLRSGEGENTFYWQHEEQARTWASYRTEGERKAEFIAPQEIAIAAKEILEQQLAMPRADLQAELIELFEFGRKTERLRNIMDAGIQLALERGDITQEGEQCKI